MKNKIFLLIIICLFSFSLYSQDKEEDKNKDKKDDIKKTEATSDRVYKEVILEDFEKTQYTKKNISVRIFKDKKYGGLIRSDFPAPVNKSTKYLGIKIYGRHGDILTIKPVKKIFIEDYCKTISFWVYGKNFSGELSFFLKDAKGKSHRLILGKLNFLGWRKLTVKLTKKIRQEDKYLSKPSKMEILSIKYNPGNTGAMNRWNYFYIDDISANMRKKYVDKQSDNW